MPRQSSFEHLLKVPGVKVQGVDASSPAILSPLGRRFIDLWNVAVATDPKAFKLTAEYEFSKLRKFRFDFAHLETRIAIELHGGVNEFAGMKGQGRHNRPEGFISDCAKWRLAAAEGWRVFPFTSKDLTAGEIVVLRECIARGLAHRSVMIGV